MSEPAASSSSPAQAAGGESGGTSGAAGVTGGAFALRDLFRLRAPLPRLVSALIAIGASVLVLLVWEGVARLGLTSPLFFPAPSAILAAMMRMFADQHLAWNAWVSILRVWSAFLLAAVMAVPIGMMMSA